MADISGIFHWTPDYMDRLSLVELMDWRERARVRNGGTDDE